jgi:hypothetical protein
MNFGNGFVEGSVRRRFALVALTLAALLAMLIGSAALRPSNAKAWAWKDTCTLFVFNKTGVQTTVRPILYTPLLPNPASIAQYVAFAAIGIPTSGAAAFTNTGYPAPTYGCHAFMNFSNPGPTVSCKVSAPTTGANTFSCEGNATTTTIRDDDDIAGNVFIPSGSGTAGPQPAEPKVGPAAVQVGTLPGDGWRKSTKITDFGLAGKLMETETLPSNCDKSGDETPPNVVSSEQLVRAGGDQGVGAIVSTYDNSAQAKNGVEEAVSNHSIDCLAKLLSSTDLRTQVAVQPLPAANGNGNGNVDGNQLVISRRVNGDLRVVSYLDVIGWTEGNEAAVEMIETVGDAPDEAAESAAVDAVRIGN